MTRDSKRRKDSGEHARRVLYSQENPHAIPGFPSPEESRKIAFCLARHGYRAGTKARSL